VHQLQERYWRQLNKNRYPKEMAIDKLSVKLRQAGINLADQKIRIVCFDNSEQSNDFTLPSNCHGWGRIHHFERSQGKGWPLDPLPIDPAIRALDLPDADEISAQVFQNAICNFQCWYCYVDRQLIKANPGLSSFLNVGEMLDLYLSEDNRPPILDLSGGQPDLVPEWTLWFADVIHDRHLDNKIYLWSDDNLSNDFLWQFLSKEQIKRLASYRNYGRVGCFKGFDEHSFSFNTSAPPELFKSQFSLMRRLVESGFDVYGYVTLTSDIDENLNSRISNFVDRLQKEVHPLFPLRTIPQRILEFTPMKQRMNPKHMRALAIQDEAVLLWQVEIKKRFPLDIIKKQIYEHKLVM
jgi:uncharacterized Fe-S cluster-containing radical SAM superfamily protein